MGVKVYIAGRITGDPRYREKFAEAEAALREVGHIPLNPAVLPEGMEAEDYMRICTAMLDSADAIGLLGDWTDSPGAQLELHYANYVGKKTVDLWKMLAVRRSTEVRSTEVRSTDVRSTDVRSTEVREENVGRVPADTDPALIAALRCSATVGGDKDCASCAYGCRVGDHMPPEAQVLLRVLADEPDCDCDRIALDTAQRLEELTEIRTNEKHK